ncbi:MAG: hypothetical protein IJE08_13695 [Clostridia bacterium]|nr:hypothetical protein [Clostridia bacterium]
MTSKEIVRRVIRHQDAPRIAWDFKDGIHKDIRGNGSIYLLNERNAKYTEFGNHEELQKKANFHGEVRMDAYGNIYGRLNGKTKGECVLGALETDWDLLEQYEFPKLDMAAVERGKAMDFKNHEKYILSYLPLGVFSTLRDLRKMNNALMDTAAEPEMVEAYMEKFTPFLIDIVHQSAEVGSDGIYFCDDWGMQFSPFISPDSFRRLFKPVYKAVADACHERDMDFILHSCGYVKPLVEDMLDAGIDCFQFDQIESVGSRVWAEEYGRRAAFYSPVDIQKIMPTGDRELIEKTAFEMVDAFKKAGGSLIAKDYPSWEDINVEREWADWAMNVILANSEL